MTSDPLSDLELRLADAAERRIAAAPTPAPRAARGRRARRRRHSRRFALLVALSLLAVSTAAWAATQLIGTGAPVQYRFGHPPTPHAGYGTPIASTVQLHPPVPDPGGGAPWALRTFHTTRGFGCLQLGRLYKGKLGLIGSDGAFADDGLFHELRPDMISSYANCIALDGSDHPRLAVHEGRLPASGTLMCANGPCHATHLRDVEYGFAGPEAASISYRSGGASGTVKATGPDGAYLVVLKARPAGHLVPGSHIPPSMRDNPTIRFADDSFLIGATPSSPALTRVRFKDGSSCAVRESRLFAGGCHAHGPVPIDATLPPTAAVRTPLHATITGTGSAMRLHATYTARAAAAGQHSGYVLLVAGPERDRGSSVGHVRCSSLIGAPLDRDVSAGHVVHQMVGLGDFRGCAGSFRLVLQYRIAPRLPQVTASLAYPGRVAGTARVTAR